MDGNLTTSRGPSTALAFAYELVEQLGGDAESLRDGMLYRDVFEINSKTRVRLSFLIYSMSKKMFHMIVLRFYIKLYKSIKIRLT